MRSLVNALPRPKNQGGLEAVVGKVVGTDEQSYVDNALMLIVLSPGLLEKCFVTFLAENHREVGGVSSAAIKNKQHLLIRIWEPVFPKMAKN